MAYYSPDISRDPIDIQKLNDRINENVAEALKYIFGEERGSLNLSEEDYRRAEEILSMVASMEEYNKCIIESQPNRELLGKYAINSKVSKLRLFLDLNKSGKMPKRTISGLSRISMVNGKECTSRPSIRDGKAIAYTCADRILRSASLGTYFRDFTSDGYATHRMAESMRSVIESGGTIVNCFPKDIKLYQEILEGAREFYDHLQKTQQCKINGSNYLRHPSYVYQLESRFDRYCDKALDFAAWGEISGKIEAQKMDDEMVEAMRQILSKAVTYSTTPGTRIRFDELMHRSLIDATRKVMVEEGHNNTSFDQCRKMFIRAYNLEERQRAKFSKKSYAPPEVEQQRDNMKRYYDSKGVGIRHAHEYIRSRMADLSTDNMGWVKFTAALMGVELLRFLFTAVSFDAIDVLKGSWPLAPLALRQVGGFIAGTIAALKNVRKDKAITALSPNEQKQILSEIDARIMGMENYYKRIATPDLDTWVKLEETRREESDQFYKERLRREAAQRRIDEAKAPRYIHDENGVPRRMTLSSIEKTLVDQGYIVSPQETPRRPRNEAIDYREVNPTNEEDSPRSQTPPERHRRSDRYKKARGNSDNEFWQ